jgi:hypothetical protein
MEKTKKVVQAVNFEVSVLEALERRCKKENTSISNFVNYHIKQVVINELEWARAQAKFHASELAKWEFELKHLQAKQDIKQVEIWLK